MHKALRHIWKNARAHNEGFTLVELLIAISILSIATIALVALVTVNTTTAARAENKSRISDAMAQLADELRSMAYGDVGKVLTYTADGGHIVLNLNVRTYKEDSVNAKIVKIEGRSRKLDPNNVEELTVILRSSDRSEEIEIDPTIGKGTLQDFVIYENNYYKAVQDGDTVWGPLTFDARIAFGTVYKNLQSVRMFINGAQVYESINPEWWVIHRLIVSDPGSRFPDGILHARVEVIDGNGSYMDWDRFITLDNHAPSMDVADTVVPNVTTVGGISAAWEMIPDPAGGQAAMRYKAVLIAKDSAGDVLSTEEVITTNPSPEVAGETVAKFDTPYSSANSYELYVYVMCPPNCKHEATGSSPISSDYIYRKF